MGEVTLRDRLPSGRERLFFDSLDSTNSEAVRRGHHIDAQGLWLQAGRQTAGRGRSGRQWVSAPGNLYATFAFRRALPMAHLPQLSLVAGVALWDAVAAHLPFATPKGRLTLKWPNDLLLDGAKLAGILTECHEVSGERQPPLILIGIGVNLVSHPRLPEGTACHLGAFGPPPSAQDLVTALDDTLARWLAIWEGAQDFSPIRSAWSDRGLAYGTPLTVALEGRQIRGRFAGIDGEGALRLMTDDGTTRRILAGEVGMAGVPAGEGREEHG